MARDNLKLILLGESTVGKTSIVLRLWKNKFLDYVDSTIGASFVMLKLNENVRYDIWDTAGQERFLSLVELYYRDTNVTIIVFDVSNLKTINRIAFYLEKISKNLIPNYKILIIGNKVDLIDHDKLQETDKYVKNYTRSLNYDLDIEFLYVSAKTGENYDTLTQILIDYGLDNSKIIHDTLNIQGEDEEMVNDYIIKRTCAYC